jgi:hypothetical protein
MNGKLKKRKKLVKIIKMKMMGNGRMMMMMRHNKIIKNIMMKIPMILMMTMILKVLS